MYPAHCTRQSHGSVHPRAIAITFLLGPSGLPLLLGHVLLHLIVPFPFDVRFKYSIWIAYLGAHHVISIVGCVCIASCFLSFIVYTIARFCSVRITPQIPAVISGHKLAFLIVLSPFMGAMIGYLGAKRLDLFFDNVDASHLKAYSLGPIEAATAGFIGYFFVSVVLRLSIGGHDSPATCTSTTTLALLRRCSN